jgi:hypothetical protein
MNNTLRTVSELIADPSGRALSGIAGSNLNWGMDVCVL